jgi:hypothetical protein
MAVREWLQLASWRVHPVDDAPQLMNWRANRSFRLQIRELFRSCLNVSVALCSSNAGTKRLEPRLTALVLSAAEQDIGVFAKLTNS